MPRYMPVSTKGTAAIAVCSRCGFKVRYDDLMPDGNSPGLRVCSKCRDVKDPYRYPARKTENISLRFPRPDDNLVLAESPPSVPMTTEELLNTAVLYLDFVNQVYKINEN